MPEVNYNDDAIRRWLAELEPEAMKMIGYAPRVDHFDAADIANTRYAELLDRYEDLFELSRNMQVMARSAVGVIVILLVVIVVLAVKFVW